MLCCLNPTCPKPQNPDGTNFCQTCGTGLVALLRYRYRVQKQLGGGGFGKTYLAIDVDKLDERCVVKQLAPQVQGSQALQKAKALFKQEAQRLQQLGEHPQIPNLYACFESDGQLYLVQQFIEGQNLLQELEQQGAFNESKIAKLLSDLLPLIQSIHQQQVIHRDIKPENIIRRRRDNKLVLIDFGISKLATATAMAKPGTSIGSFGYAPLEQMQGGEAYAASDLYGLGVTCFHLLTNIHPWSLWQMQGYSWVDNWQQHLPHSISPELERVLSKLLQVKRQHRYQSVAQVLDDWNPLTTTLPSTPPSQPKTPPATRQNAITLTGHSDWVKSVALNPDGKTLASGSCDRTIKIWDLSSGQLLRTLIGHSYSVKSIALSPDGKTLASGSCDRTIKIWDLPTGKLTRTLTGHADWVNSVAYSPDGKTLASGSCDKSIRIWDLSTGKLIRILTGHSYSVNSVAYSPDGMTLASGSSDETIKIWDLSTGELTCILTGHSYSVNSVAYSPDGKTLASGSNDETIKIWDLSTGKLTRNLTGHSYWVKSVAYSPDGCTLASGSNDKTIKIWDLSTGQLVNTLVGAGHSDWVYSVAFSLDGKTLASGSAVRTIKIWQMSQ